MIRLISNSDLNLKVIGALEHRGERCRTAYWKNCDLIFSIGVTLAYI